MILFKLILVVAVINSVVAFWLFWRYYYREQNTLMEQ